MTSTRAPVPPVDLKARIAALQQQQHANAQPAAGTTTSQPLPKANAVVTGNNALRDRIASFEKQGAVPKPKGRFGFAPPMEKDATTTKRGELYGNRVPGLSRPHIPVPPSSKSDKKQPRSRSASRLELDRYATSPSPPGSPFIVSDNGDSVGDVFSDGDANSPNDPASLEESQQQSIDALVESANDDVTTEEQETTEVPSVAPADVDGPSSDRPDPGADQPDESPAIAELPSDPEPAKDALPPVVDATPSQPEPPAPSELKAPTPPPVVEVVVRDSEPEPEPEPAKVLVEDAVDPAVQAVIDELDRATRLGDAGSVVVPAVSLQAIAELGVASDQQQNSVQDLLDQLLLQQDALDVATPIKQRFSLNGSLSQLAVRTYLAQQSELAAKAPETPEKKEVQPTVNTQSSSQFLSPATPSAYSPDSPVAEPLSPASDIYAAYLAPTPSVPFGRALPAIPEAPDSPAALAFKNTRRGTFGTESGGSTPPSSAPLTTPSDDSNTFTSLRDNLTKTNVHLGRIASPPLSVVIPPRTETPKPAQPANGKAEKSTPPSHPPPAARSLPAPPDSAGLSVTSPESAYSATSSYSGEGSPSSGTVSRKVSTRRKMISPLPPTSPYEEPVLTPIEGPKGFRAVVHEKVVEGKSRPVSMIMQYPDLPSPTPMNAANMSDLAMLLADAALLEKQLTDTRAPQKRLPSRPSAGPKATPTPPPATGRGISDRPRPVQDLPESPDDAELFNRLSQDQSITSRTSQYDSSRQSSQYESSRNSARQSQYEHRPLPTRPSIDRERKTSMSASRPSLDRRPSRPSLERMPSRPSLDPSSSARPSIDSTSARPQLQPMFLSADPNAVRIPLPPRPKSAMASSRSQTSTPPVPPPKSPPRTGYLTNLLSRAKSSGNLRADPRDSVGSSSEDSVMVSTPPTPPYEMTANETGSVRSSRIFKNSFSRASNFADRLLHRKEGSNQSPEVAIASGDEDDQQMAGSRSLPRPPRPLPLPPRPLPPRGLPPPVPGEQPPSNGSSTNLAPLPPPGQPGLQRRGSWKSIASVSTTGISEALDGVYDSFPSVPDTVPRAGGLPPGPNAYISPRPAPRPPTVPPPSQPLPPPPNQPLPPPPRGASHNNGLSSAGYPGLPANPAQRPKTLPSRPKIPPQKAPPTGALRSGMI
ncbi:hypothetical protein L226DRAFT_202225 [Lentinus tigrinus ALCF2SS1-7]|nr:hypothetical protein L226DRAFT_202225 [Lentinus tigrinus ALCF2SS1-7]